MTRTVFDNSMCAHVWAQQQQYEGRSHNGNLWFEGYVIYSYRTPVARIIPDGENRIALITSEAYSITTSGKYMPAIRSATRARNVAVFNVPSLGILGCHGRYAGDKDGAIDHAQNIAYFEAEYTAEVSRLMRARYLYSAHALKDISEEANRYCRAFGLLPIEFPIEDDTAKIEVAHAARHTPEAIAKREAERERRRLRELRTEEEKLEEWLAGGRARWNSQKAFTTVYLRVKGDMLETSLGASVPLTHAIRVFKFAKLCRNEGRAWHRNGHSIRVGHFTVECIRLDGSFIAGCHTIGWPEIERIARQVGVFDEAASDEALGLIAGDDND